MKKKTKKLVLAKETVRSLEALKAAELLNVQGAASGISCGTGCYEFDMPSVYDC